MVSLDGFFEGPNRELDWHNVDDEFTEFAVEQLDEIGVLLFGRVTYEGMVSYWPNASADAPAVADRMNSKPKVVVSTTLDEADWNNARLVTGNVIEEVARLKREPGDDLAIFGSSELTVSMLEAGLVDELRIMVNPILLGEGRTLFDGLVDDLELTLERTRPFENGNVLHCYRPAYRGDERTG
ncbi:dihydrofolate reductase family protein [Halosolutus gelatinilyticus]|uniref:dihydrofolate reductase family protein n=1 Tax=Halosolutus gelatinilyticus TaxID=2931975 RepID=UPI001FF5CACB|nr:dihydrofolate reductase family protein [Halosolutus gelatinilyticus]